MSISSNKKMRVLQSTGRFCAYCGLDGADTVDHIVPLSRGGSNASGNLAPAHERCNQAKGSEVIVPLMALVIFKRGRTGELRAKAGKPLLRWQYHRLRKLYGGETYWQKSESTPLSNSEIKHED